MINPIANLRASGVARLQELDVDGTRQKMGSVERTLSGSRQIFNK